MLDEDVRERLSLLVDDRLDRHAAMQVIRRTESDSEAASVFSRYLLIGEALRTNGHVIHDAQFVDRVHKALVAEPAILAPRWIKRVRDGVVTTALAAGLAGVALLVGDNILRQSNTLSLSGMVQQASSGGPSNGSSPVDTYVVSHNGTAYLAANAGLMPYLRVVSHSNPGR